MMFKGVLEMFSFNFFSQGSYSFYSGQSFDWSRWIVSTRHENILNFVLSETRHIAVTPR